MIDFGLSKKYPALKFHQRWNTYGKYCMDSVSVDGLWMEFGVASGETSKEIIKHLPNKNDVLYGFDWFKGLPEDWVVSENVVHSEGTIFGQKKFGIEPSIDGLKIINGLFEETLPLFCEDEYEIAFVHVDCDLYSSTKTIFDNIKSKLIVGTIIMFDEFHNYNNFHLHEYKAWNEFVSETGIKYDWVAHTEGQEACCVITEI